MKSGSILINFCPIGFKISVSNRDFWLQDDDYMWQNLLSTVFIHKITNKHAM
jgi:hypothetical protein